MGAGKILSQLNTGIRQGLIDSEGRVTVSEVYLTADDGEQIQLCMTPEEVRVKSSASFRSYSVVETGEIKIPKGEQLTAISWHGILPNVGMLLYPFVKHAAWDRPIELIKIIQRWREDGTKIKLLITQTPINLDVYIKAFDYTMKGGVGDYYYDIDFIAAKSLQVMTVAEADSARERKNAAKLRSRTRSKPKIGAYFGTMNSIWGIAQMLTGNGGNWGSMLRDNGYPSPDAVMTYDYLRA